MKKEELTSLVYEYKEYLIKNDLYHPYIETQFMELKVYVDNNDLETAYKKLKEIATLFISHQSSFNMQKLINVAKCGLKEKKISQLLLKLTQKKKNLSK